MCPANRASEMPTARGDVVERKAQLDGESVEVRCLTSSPRRSIAGEPDDSLRVANYCTQTAEVCAPMSRHCIRPGPKLRVGRSQVGIR